MNTVVAAIRSRVALALILGAACLGGEFLHAAPVKILLIGKEPDHPYGSHMYLHTSGMLAKCLSRTPNVTCVVSSGWPQDPAVLEGVNTIVVYTNPAAELLLDGPHRDEFDRLMKQGVGLATIHWASSVHKANVERLGPAWLGYLGGTWVSNVGLSGGTSQAKQLLPQHPICRGWESFEITDEYYLNPTIADGKPLLQVTEPKKGADVVVAWVYEREGDGRSFGTTLGHPYANFQREPFRRMIVNAILWTAHVELPAEGAPIDIPEADLALPPKP